MSFSYEAQRQRQADRRAKEDTEWRESVRQNTERRIRQAEERWAHLRGGERSSSTEWTDANRWNRSTWTPVTRGDTKSAPRSPRRGRFCGLRNFALTLPSRRMLATLPADRHQVRWERQVVEWFPFG